MSTLNASVLGLSLALAACSNSSTESSGSASESAAAVEASATVASEPAASASGTGEDPAPAAETPPIPEDTEIVTTESGLKYSVLSKGDGARKAKLGDRVSMHYTGWLPDGTVFDSSRGSGRPYTFTVGSGVIAGWSEGAQHMGLGDRLKLTIPPSLAYGPTGSPPVIPGDATLIFEVEMVEAVFMPEFHSGDVAAQVTTESGLVYEVLTEGTGATPAEGDVVDLKFAVWSEGEQLLACDQTQGQTLKGSCGDLPFEVLNEAPTLMQVGARYRFIVPADLAFGDQSPGPGVPPNSTTIWELELLSIAAPLPVPEFTMPAEGDLTLTESGLGYQVITPGTGDTVRLGQNLKVHYAGWLTDGTLFDASYKRAETLDFQLQNGGLIPGWIEGLQLMRPGSVYTFVIPSDLAYGPTGQGKIPANSTLVFLITMVEVTD